MSSPRPAQHRPAPPAPPTRSAWQALVGASAKTLARAKSAAMLPGQPVLRPERWDHDMALAILHHDTAAFDAILPLASEYAFSFDRMEAPLALSAAFGDDSKLYYFQRLLNWRANPDAMPPDDGSGPYAETSAVSAPSLLHRAAAENRPRELQALIDHGAELNLQNAKGHTALMIAARSGSLACAQALIDAGADLDARDRDTLCALDHATPIDPRHDPIHLKRPDPAEMERYIQPMIERAPIAMALLKAGASANVASTRPVGSWPPARWLSPAAAALRMQNLELFDAMLANGADASWLNRALPAAFNPYETQTPEFFVKRSEEIPEFRHIIEQARLLLSQRSLTRAAAESRPQHPAAPELAPTAAASPPEPSRSPRAILAARRARQAAAHDPRASQSHTSAS